MKIQVAKRDLEKALSVVSGGLGGSSGDLSSHYVFRVTNIPSTPDLPEHFTVEVLTSSGKIFSSCPFIASVSDFEDHAPAKSVCFTVEGKRLKTLLGFVKDAALTFDFDGTTKVVAMDTPDGTQQFQSLDPSKFIFWDGTLKGATQTAKLPANQLLAAVNYARNFVGDDEARSPKTCIMESKQGWLSAMNGTAVAMVGVEGLKKSTLRIHGKAASACASFLGTCDTSDVTIKEHDRAVFYLRTDGALFGESRFRTGFPDLQVKVDEEPAFKFVLPKEELVRGLGFLKSGADWGDYRVRIKTKLGDDQGAGGTFTLHMRSMTGKTIAYPIDCSLATKKDGASDLPSKGFDMHYDVLTKFLSAWGEDEVSFGVSLLGAGRGYTRFYREEEGNKYLTVVAWLR